MMQNLWPILLTNSSSTGWALLASSTVSSSDVVGETLWVLWRFSLCKVCLPLLLLFSSSSSLEMSASLRWRASFSWLSAFFPAWCCRAISETRSHDWLKSVSYHSRSPWSVPPCLCWGLEAECSRHLMVMNGEGAKGYVYDLWYVA